MRNNNNNADQNPAQEHTLPSRRERLGMLMRLKSQRRMAFAGTGLFAAVALALGGMMVQDNTTPDMVKLGKGTASVETMQVSQIEPVMKTPSPRESAIGDGEASFYGTELAGNRTANGEAFDPYQLTAAHRTLPLGSEVRVTNPRNDASVIVRINDRGPYHGNRVIDLSYAAAQEIGLIRSGTGRVNLALLVT
ncbi:MAG: septal ring lytic transglycosylase RlpA family protein [Alteraurantiacibacter sp.]